MAHVSSSSGEATLLHSHSALRGRDAAGRRGQGGEDREGEERPRKDGRDRRHDGRVPADWTPAEDDGRRPRRRGGGGVADEAVHLDAVGRDQLVLAAVVDGDDDLSLGRAGRRSRRAGGEALLAAADAAQAELGRVLQLAAGSRAQLQHLRPINEPSLESPAIYAAQVSVKTKKSFPTHTGGTDLLRFPSSLSVSQTPAYAVRPHTSC